MISHIYTEIWSSLSSHIIEVLTKGESHTDWLNPEIFTSVGDRDSYRFRLEFMNGRVYNNIGGSAVARDLAEVLLNSAKFKILAADKHIVIRMGKNFDLHCDIDKMEK